MASLARHRSEDDTTWLGLLPFLLIVGSGETLFGFAFVHSVLVGREALAGTLGGILLLWNFAALVMGAMSAPRRGSFRASAIIRNVGEMTFESTEALHTESTFAAARATVARATECDS